MVEGLKSVRELRNARVKIGRELSQIKFVEDQNFSLASFMENPALSDEFRNAVNVAIERSRLQGRLETLAYVMEDGGLDPTDILSFISDPAIFPTNPLSLPDNKAYELLKGVKLPRTGY